MTSVSLARDQLLIYSAAFLRALGIGMSGVLLGLYLAAVGWDAARIGLLVGTGLAGTALATFLSSFLADRLGRRRVLVTLSGFGVLGGLSLVTTTEFWPLLAGAFFGMVNGMGRDRGPAFSVEQAILPATVPDVARTTAFAWYNLVGDAGHAVGNLLASLPFWLRRGGVLETMPSYQAAWVIYALLSFTGVVLYALLSRQVEVSGRTNVRPISPQSKRVVTKLAGLFAIDSLGGGFLSDALFSYWFFRRFGVGEELLGPLFFLGRIINALSYLVAVRLARRIGLLNTMVFTHIPSSLFLLLVPFAPTFALAVVFFLLRECLVEMDVPTRQSYVVAVVQPEERTFASGITNVTRNISWAVAPSLAGYAMKTLSLASPLFVCGGVKIVYDVLLFLSFRRLKPPEEQMEVRQSEPRP